MTFLNHIALVALTLLKFGVGQTFPNPGCTSIARPPKNPNGKPALCNARGVFGAAPTNGSVITADNLQQCQNLCLRRQSTLAGNTDSFDAPACYTLIYNSNTKTCTLIDYDLSDSFKSNAASLTTVSQARCYSCPSTCPSPTGVNLIDNPGFEASSTLYGPFVLRQPGGPATANIVKPGRNSASALSTQGTTDKDGTGWFLETKYNACRNRPYLLSFDIKPQYLPTVAPKIYFFTTGFIFIANAPMLPNGTWQNFTQYIYSIDVYDSDDYAPNVERDLDYITIVHDNAAVVPVGTYSVVYDNFKVVSAGTSSFKPSGRELLKNPGFETGALAPWNVTFTFETEHAVRKPGISSTYSFHADPQNNKENFFATEFFLRQAIPKLVIGATYVLQVDYQSPELLYLILTLGPLSHFDITCANGVPCNGTAQRAFIATAGMTELEVRVQNGANAGPILIDNVSLKKL